MIYHLTISVQDDPDFPYQLTTMQKLLKELETVAVNFGCNLYDSSFEMGD